MSFGTCVCACVFQHEAPGYFVVQVKATDEDAGQNGVVRYEFVTSASSRPDYQYFDINATSGVITVAQDVDRELIDQLFVSTTCNVRLCIVRRSRFKFDIPRVVTFIDVILPIGSISWALRSPMNVFA